MSNLHSPIPAIPGQLQDEGRARELRRKVADLLELKHERFPGAQPISFSKESLSGLENENFFVAEKSDGVRCLALMTTSREGKPEVYLFDRKNNYYFIPNLRFPIPGDPRDQDRKGWHADTIIDGELVVDTEADGTRRLRFLVFDCLVCDRKILIQRSLMKRLGYLKENILQPYAHMIQSNPNVARVQPFSVEFKEQQFAYHLETVFREVIPNLKHGNDGLIFTSAVAPYSLGTCEKMLKWKPAEENSIDFRLSLDYPPSSTIPGVKSMGSRPRFLLLMWKGGEAYEYYGELGVTDQEWAGFQASRERLQDRIVEVVYDVERQQREGLSSPWRLLRFRDDKPSGNHVKTVEKVVASIKDAVDRETLIEHMPRIRAAWKHREANGEGQ